MAASAPISLKEALMVRSVPLLILTLFHTTPIEADCMMLLSAKSIWQITKTGPFRFPKIVQLKSSQIL